MKKIVLSLVVVATTLAFGQKKEIRSAFKAVESGDLATATAKIQEAENLLSGRTELLEPSVLEEYYYTKGFALLKNGKIAEGAKYLSLISDLGKSKIYTGKDSNKNRVYFVGKASADKSGIENLKEDSYSPALLANLGAQLNPTIQAVNKEAMDAYNSKNYKVAAPKFAEIYYLLKAAGQDNKIYLYYSAVAYAQGKDNLNAIEAYKNLVDIGYTGVETKYLAKNKKTGQVENIDKASWELLKKASNGDFEDFRMETSESVELELYETCARLLLETERYEEAVALIEKGLKKFPNNGYIHNDLLTINMIEKGGIYEIPCKVNGIDMKFIFDTGASNVSISLAEALFMIKNGYLKREDIGEKIYYSIANGDVEEGTLINIGEIEIGGLKLKNVEASIVHNMSAPLLLGMSAISKLGKIQLEGSKLIILSAKRESKNNVLKELQGLAYYKSGRTEEFISSLKQAVAKNPEDKTALYNLGVMLSKDPNKKSEAVSYFEKVISLDKKSTDAWQNLITLLIGDEEGFWNEYRPLRDSNKNKDIEKANKLMDDRKKRLLEAVSKAEEWHKSDPTNLDAIGRAKELYSALRNELKIKEFKAKEQALKK